MSVADHSGGDVVPGGIARPEKRMVGGERAIVYLRQMPVFLSGERRPGTHHPLSQLQCDLLYPEKETVLNTMQDVPENQSSAAMPMFLMEASLFCEYALQEQWNSIPLNVPLRLRYNGNELKVISRGHWNRETGPDFLNAKLEIDGKEICGDVEIHCHAADWMFHGHSADPAYKNVILHVLGSEKLPGKAAKEIPLLPVYVMPDEFDNKTQQEIRRTVPRGEQGRCAPFFARITDDALHRFTGDAGLDRMRGKSDLLLTEMIEHGTADAFLRKLFELVGMPGNREQFRDLANRVLRYPKEIRAERLEALLWGESGLLPDPAHTDLAPDALALVRGLWDQWWNVRKTHQEPIRFNRRCRPLNSICRKLALLSGFIRHFGENPLPGMIGIIEKESVEDAIRIFMEKLSPEDDFWTVHTSFTTPVRDCAAALIGRDRILELLADVLVPAMHAYASVTKNFKQIVKIESFFLTLPKTGSNLTIRRAVALCFPGRENVLKTVAAQQGVLHIYKMWCEKLSCDCRECPICKLV